MAGGRMKDRVERDYDDAIAMLKTFPNAGWLVDRITRRVAQLEMQAEVEAYRNRGQKPWARATRRE